MLLAIQLAFVAVLLLGAAFVWKIVEHARHSSKQDHEIKMLRMEAKTLQARYNALHEKYVIAEHIRINTEKEG